MAYDVLPYEVLDLVVADPVEGLGLDPLSEVVSDCELVNLLNRGHWEFADDVHPPLRERP